MADLNGMVVFAAVARAQSFTAAARLLGMPKSTVSQRVAALEGRLGVKLLHRTTRKVRLTDTGAAYADRCLRLLAEATEADREATQQGAELRGRLRVTTSLLFGHTFLAPLLAEYLTRYPEVSVDAVLTDRQVDLVEEGVDIAIRSAGPLHGSFVARRLGPATSRVCASPSYLAGRRPPREPADLRDHPCIGVGARDGRMTWSFDREGQAETIEVQARVNASSMLFARDAAVLGLGVALLPAFLREAEVTAGRLVPLLPGWEAGRTMLHAVYPAGRYQVARVRAFVELLMEQFAAGPPWLGSRQA